MTLWELKIRPKRVYSNQPSVALYINGKLAEEKAAEEKSPEEKQAGKPIAGNLKSGKGTKSPEGPNPRLDAESRGETGQKKPAGVSDGPISEKKQESIGQMESEGPKLVKMQADKPEDTKKQHAEEKQTEVRQAEELQIEDTGVAEDTTDGFQTVKEEDVPFPFSNAPVCSSPADVCSFCCPLLPGLPQPESQMHIQNTLRNTIPI